MKNKMHTASRPRTCGSLPLLRLRAAPTGSGTPTGRRAARACRPKRQRTRALPPLPGRGPRASGSARPSRCQVARSHLRLDARAHHLLGVQLQLLRSGQEGAGRACWHGPGQAQGVRLRGGRADSPCSIALAAWLADGRISRISHRRAAPPPPPHPAMARRRGAESGGRQVRVEERGDERRRGDGAPCGARGRARRPAGAARRCRPAGTGAGRGGGRSAMRGGWCQLSTTSRRPACPAAGKHMLDALDPATHPPPHPLVNHGPLLAIKRPLLAVKRSLTPAGWGRRARWR